MDLLSYVNDEWVVGNPPVVGTGDHALWMASTVFDGLRAFESTIPDADRHCERVVRSAKAMGLQPALTGTEIRDLVFEGARRFGRDAVLYIRPMFWATEGWAVRLCRSWQVSLCTANK